MIGSEIILVISFAVLLFLSCAQIGSVERNSMVAVGFLQMMVIMLLLSVFLFMVKDEQVDFMNILQIVSISFFLSFLNSFIMLRQTLVRPWEW